MRDVHLLIGMEQQVSKVDEALQARDDYPDRLVADAEEPTLVENDRFLRRNS
jgi:hypothetical protein